MWWRTESSHVSLTVGGSVSKFATSCRLPACLVLLLAAQLAVPAFAGWRDTLHRAVSGAPQRPHPAIVQVLVPDGGAYAQGSGSLIHLHDAYGVVITNWHVIRDATADVQVRFADGFQSAATVMKTDRDWDLAALVIWRPSVKPLPLASTAPRPGDTLTIAGYGPGDYRAVTGRCTQYVSPGDGFPYEMVELSAQARQGDSGGPILNQRGELAGVLFGAANGATSGSYVHRVRWFLEPVIRHLQTSTQRNSQPSRLPRTHSDLRGATFSPSQQDWNRLAPHEPAKPPQADSWPYDSPERQPEAGAPTEDQRHTRPRTPDHGPTPLPALPSTGPVAEGHFPREPRVTMPERFTDMPRRQPMVTVDDAAVDREVDSASGHVELSAWKQWAGETRWEQGKSILAVIGVISLAMSLLRRS